MRRLLLLRHAKAETATADPSGGGEGRDRARHLTPQGRRDADSLGRFILARGLVPDHALVSPVQRTRETFTQLQAAWNATVPATYEPRIYDPATPDVLLDLVHRTHDAPTLLLIGHNPGLYDFAATLVGAGDAPTMSRFNLGGFPTAALAAIDFPGDTWAAITPESGWLATYTSPRILAENNNPHADTVPARQNG